MKAQASTRELSDFSPFGELASFGAACVGLDLTPERGYVSGAVALLKSYAGGFGWRLTKRQAGALARAGFACPSWK